MIHIGGFGGHLVRKALALQVGTAASAVLLAMTVAAPAAHAACNDYGQPPCPVPTVTPEPPSPSPTPTPRPTVTPTPTPIETLIPVPTETTNPERAQVVGGGAVIVVSQETADNAPPRLVLQPLGTSADTSQVVVVQRLAAEQIIVQFLQPKLRYVSQILVDGKWSDLGSNTSNSKGQLILPAIRGVALGEYPVRIVAQPAKNAPKPATRFFRLSVVRDKSAVVSPSPSTTS